MFTVAGLLWVLGTSRDPDGVGPWFPAAAWVAPCALGFGFVVRRFEEHASLPGIVGLPALWLMPGVFLGWALLRWRAARRRQFLGLRPAEISDRLRDALGRLATRRGLPALPTDSRTRGYLELALGEMAAWQLDEPGVPARIEAAVGSSDPESIRDHGSRLLRNQMEKVLDDLEKIAT